jgi:hypothetical protein
MAGSKGRTADQRLLELEQRQREIENWYSQFYTQSKGRVSPFLGEKISLGGFFESAVTTVGGTDTNSQISANSNLFGINLAAEFDETFRFVSQVITGLSYTFSNAHNNPHLTPSTRQYGAPAFGALVAASYFELRRSEAFAVQTGLGYTPFGHAFQQREPVLLKRRSGPQMVGAAGTTTVGTAFPLWMGVHILGAFPLERGRVGYSLYSFSPSMKPTTLGAGTRLWWNDSQHMTAGVSFQTAEQTNNSYYSYGVDLEVKYNKFGLLTEFAQNVGSADAPSISTYYFEPYYTFADGEWIVYGVVDYMNNPTRLAGAVSDSYKKLQLGGGINWLPIQNVRFRIGFINHNYLGASNSINGQKRDYYSVDFSTGVAF